MAKKLRNDDDAVATHRRALDDLQKAIDGTATPGDKAKQRAALKRALARERKTRPEHESND